MLYISHPTIIHTHSLSLHTPHTTTTLTLTLTLTLLTLPPHAHAGAVPLLIMAGLLLLWFCISVPLVFLGAYFGYKKDPLEFPVVTSNIPREIPEQPW